MDVPWAALAAAVPLKSVSSWLWTGTGGCGHVRTWRGRAWMLCRQVWVGVDTLWMWIDRCGRCGQRDLWHLGLPVPETSPHSELRWARQPWRGWGVPGNHRCGHMLTCRQGCGHEVERPRCWVQVHVSLSQSDFGGPHLLLDTSLSPPPRVTSQLVTSVQPRSLGAHASSGMFPPMRGVGVLLCRHLPHPQGQHLSLSLSLDPVFGKRRKKPGSSLSCASQARGLVLVCEGAGPRRGH